jgi:hypothetical protein
MIVNQKNSPNGLLLIVTDKDIIGKKFKENNLCLDLTSNFYKGVEMKVDEILNLINQCYILHLTGKKSIELGLKYGLVDQTISVQKIPHAEIVFEPQN